MKPDPNTFFRNRKKRGGCCIYSGPVIWELTRGC